MSYKMHLCKSMDCLPLFRIQLFRFHTIKLCASSHVCLASVYSDLLVTPNFLCFIFSEIFGIPLQGTTCKVVY